MQHTAKVFINGRSQAVRLPAEFRFDTKEVYIRRDPVTGDVILSQKLDSWSDVFSCLDEAEAAGDFLRERDQLPLQARDVF